MLRTALLLVMPAVCLAALGDGKWPQIVSPEQGQPQEDGQGHVYRAATVRRRGHVRDRLRRCLGQVEHLLQILRQRQADGQLRDHHRSRQRRHRLRRGRQGEQEPSVHRQGLSGQLRRLVRRLGHLLQDLWHRHVDGELRHQHRGRQRGQGLRHRQQGHQEPEGPERHHGPRLLQAREPCRLLRRLGHSSRSGNREHLKILRPRPSARGCASDLHRNRQLPAYPRRRTPS